VKVARHDEWTTISWASVVILLTVVQAYLFSTEGITSPLSLLSLILLVCVVAVYVYRFKQFSDSQGDTLETSLISLRKKRLELEELLDKHNAELKRTQVNYVHQESKSLKSQFLSKMMTIRNLIAQTTALYSDLDHRV
jgi:Ca2+/Na+ antiporter